MKYLFSNPKLSSRGVCEPLGCCSGLAQVCLGGQPAFHAIALLLRDSQRKRVWAWLHTSTVIRVVSVASAPVKCSLASSKTWWLSPLRSRPMGPLCKIRKGKGRTQEAQASKRTALKKNGARVSEAEYALQSTVAVTASELLSEFDISVTEDPDLPRQQHTLRYFYIFS